MSSESRAAENSTPDGTGLNGLRILAADCNPQNRTLLKHVLMRAGAEVELAVDGYEALDKFAETPFDAVVLDAKMPRLDGYETVKRMRNASRGPRIPILMLTALTTEEELSTSRAAGADDCLTKPFSPKQLVAMIVHLVNSVESTPSDSSVEYDSELDELRTEFLEYHENIVSAYLETTPDYETLCSWAHQFAGSAGSFGYQELTDRARDIERTINSGASSVSLMKHFTTILERIHDFQMGRV